MAFHSNWKSCVFMELARRSGQINPLHLLVGHHDECRVSRSSLRLMFSNFENYYVNPLKTSKGSLKIKNPLNAKIENDECFV